MADIDKHPNRSDGARAAQRFRRKRTRVGAAAWVVGAFVLVLVASLLILTVSLLAGISGDERTVSGIGDAPHAASKV